MGGSGEGHFLRLTYQAVSIKESRAAFACQVEPCGHLDRGQLMENHVCGQNARMWFGYSYCELVWKLVKNYSKDFEDFVFSCKMNTHCQKQRKPLTISTSKVLTIFFHVVLENNRSRSGIYCHRQSPNKPGCLAIQTSFKSLAMEISTSRTQRLVSILETPALSPVV